VCNVYVYADIKSTVFVNEDITVADIGVYRFALRGARKGKY